MKNPKNYSIVKHNALIEARYKLTLHEQKLVLNVAMMIKPEDQDFHEYRVSIRDFIDLMGLSGQAGYNSIKGKTESILKKPLAIDHAEGTLFCNWFSSIDYLKRRGEVVLCFDPKLKPYLIQLKNNFTEYKSLNVMRLQSVFSIRIYEILKQYLKIGERVIKLDALRAMLGVSEKYPRYPNVRQRILEPAKKELSQTDISFTYEPIKTGRRVTAIRFIIKPNRPKIKDTSKKPKGSPQQCINSVDNATPGQHHPDTIDPAEKTFLDAVASHGTDATLARRAIDDHSIVGATEILASAVVRHQAKPKRDFAAYLAQALRQGWGLKSPEKRETERLKAERMAARAVKFEKDRAEKKERGRRTARTEEEEKDKIQAEWNRLDTMVELLQSEQYDALRAQVSGNRKLTPSLLKVRMRKAVEEFLKGNTTTSK
jgi:hypothetical protein